MKEHVEHVEHLESGGMACRHCGGAVDADGYAIGGDVEGPDDTDGEDTAMRDGETDEEPQQHAATLRMRKRSLADALASRRGD